MINKIKIYFFKWLNVNITLSVKGTKITKNVYVWLLSLENTCWITARSILGISVHYSSPKKQTTYHYIITLYKIIERCLLAGLQYWGLESSAGPSVSQKGRELSISSVGSWKSQGHRRCSPDPRLRKGAEGNQWCESVTKGRRSWSHALWQGQPQ